MFGTLRKRRQSIYLVITGAMILGMGFFGIGTAMKNQEAQSGAVAIVNGEPVTADEVGRRIRMQQQRVRAMLGDQADAFMAQMNLEGRALDEAIDEKVSLLESKRLHIGVPDAELVEVLSTIPDFQKDGKFDVDSYEKIPNRGEYEAGIRENLANNKFHEYVYERIRLTPTEIRNSYMVKETKADVQYARINLNEMAAKTKPTAEQLSAAAADQPALDAYFQEHRSEFTVPASAQLRQIRVAVPFQASAAQKDEAKKKIQAIAVEANSANFAEVAKAKSDDEYAKKGGEMGWTDVKNLEPQVRSAIEKLEPGQITGVLETPYAFLLVKVEGKKAEKQKELAEVKGVVTEKVAAKKASTAFAAEKQKAFDQILAQGKSLEPELKKANIEVKKTGPFSLGQGYLPNVGKADELLDAIFTLTLAKPVYPKLVRFQDDYYYLKLLTLDKAKESELAKNPETFDKSLASSLQMELYKDWMEDAKKKAKIQTLVKLDQGPTPFEN